MAHHLGTVLESVKAYLTAPLKAHRKELLMVALKVLQKADLMEALKVPAKNTVHHD